MVDLPSVVLLTVDVVRPHLALESIRRTLHLATFQSCHLLTDLKRWRDLDIKAKAIGVKLTHHEESNKVVRFPGITRAFFQDYELAVLTEPDKLMVANPKATHVLFKEWDAGVLNPAAWDPAFLEYDFIGAPWPPHVEAGYPPCDGRTNAVGNTGFSLQSRKFTDLASQLAIKTPDLMRYASDIWICRTMRPTLEKLGVRFAPVDVAARFSCENCIYAGAFGFHGRSTADLNGWGGWMQMFRKAT